MFLATMKNGDRIPVEDWILLLWVKDELKDPTLLSIIQNAKSLHGDWRSVRALSVMPPGWTPKQD